MSVARVFIISVNTMLYKGLESVHFRAEPRIELGYTALRAINPTS
ncbi:MAG: hypothetical protein RL212_366 [Pseudomonadota bacterium]|jgi:hypothetical protein